MQKEEKLKKLRVIELGINKNLYMICGGVTLIVMLMILLEFFTRGAFPTTRIGLFYIGILLIYSLHKELVRWLGERKVERQGEIFVYTWIGLTTLLYIIDFLTKNYFSYSSSGESLITLKEVSLISLQVLIIFIVTRASKLIKVFLLK